MNKPLELRLKYDSYERIAKRQKNYEVRLDKGIYSRLNLHDTLIFHNPGNTAYLIREVAGIIRVPTFKDLFDLIGPNELGHSSDMQYSEWEKRIRHIYSEQQEIKFGVIGIKLR